MATHHFLPVKLAKTTASPILLPKWVGFQIFIRFRGVATRDVRLLLLPFLVLAILSSCSRNTKVFVKDQDDASSETSIEQREDPLNPSDPLQQTMLGWRYHAGEGVIQDFAEGVKWYRKAAEQGVTIAQVALGNCYVKGEGVDRDLSEAAEWFRRAAEQGDSDGQFRLGLCYESGAGTELDLTRAYMWYNLAAASENDETAADARKNQGTLAKKMSRHEIAEAQRLSREWRKK